MRNASGPDLSHLYLTGQMGKDHPEFERIHRMYKDSPEGKTLARFRKDNAEREDGLDGKNYQQLQQVIRDELVPYNGKPEDRISMIRAIRKNRDMELAQQLDEMTPEEVREFQVHQNLNRAKRDAAKRAAKSEEDRQPIQQKVDKAELIKMNRDSYIQRRSQQRLIAHINQYNQSVEVAKRKGQALPVPPEGLENMVGADGYIQTTGKVSRYIGWSKAQVMAELEKRGIEFKRNDPVETLTMLLG